MSITIQTGTLTGQHDVTDGRYTFRVDSNPPDEGHRYCILFTSDGPHRWPLAHSSQDMTSAIDDGFSHGWWVSDYRYGTAVVTLDSVQTDQVKPNLGEIRQGTLARATIDGLPAGTYPFYLRPGGYPVAIFRGTSGPWDGLPLHQYVNNEERAWLNGMGYTHGWSVYDNDRDRIEWSHFARPVVKPEPVRRFGALRFVSSGPDYSTYLDHADEPVYLQNGTGRTLLAFDTVPLTEWWDRYEQEEGDEAYVSDFREWVKDRVIDPDHADKQISWCEDCDDLVRSDGRVPVNAGARLVCDECADDDYYMCLHCQTRYSDTRTVRGDNEVCEGCYENAYRYCEDCDVDYHIDDGCGGRHSDDCGCYSPVPHFKVRNDGHGMLRENERTTVTLAAGVISDEGVAAIGDALRDHGNALSEEIKVRDEWGTITNLEEVCAARQPWHDLSFQLYLLDQKWQTKDGNYTKRLSRQAYKNHKLKIPADLLSQIGNIGSEHSRAVDHAIEVTRDLNLSAEDFGHEGSCWWTEYSYSRCALKTNGGFGLRSFDGRGYVTGRAWVLPVRLLPDRAPGDRRAFTPTFETEKPDAFVVFNGYHALSGYTPARIMAHMAGVTYRKVSLEIEPMYVNSGSAYLIAAEEIAAPYTDGSLYLDLEQHSDLFDDEQAATEESKELAHA